MSFRPTRLLGEWRNLVNGISPCVHCTHLVEMTHRFCFLTEKQNHPDSFCNIQNNSRVITTQSTCGELVEPRYHLVFGKIFVEVCSRVVILNLFQDPESFGKCLLTNICLKSFDFPTLFSAISGLPAPVYLRFVLENVILACRESDIFALDSGQAKMTLKSCSSECSEVMTSSTHLVFS